MKKSYLAIITVLALIFIMLFSFFNKSNSPSTENNQNFSS